MQPSRRFTLALPASLWLLLAACSGSNTNPNFDSVFTEANAWQGDIPGDVPGDADTVSPEEFKKGVDSGELVLVSAATLQAQKEAREKSFRDDKTFLQSVPDKSPDLQALLTEAASVAGYEGDRPVTLPDGQTVVLFGLGSQLDNAAAAYERSQGLCHINLL